MHRRHALVLSTAALAAVVAACGGSDDLSLPAPPPPALAAPQISADPQPLTVGEGGNATFAVAASGTPEPQFQWFIDGSGPMAGATGASYVREAVGLLDDGLRFGVTASNSQGSTTSALATLSVTERSWTAAALPPSGANDALPAPTFGGHAPALVVDGRGHTHALFTQQESGGAWTVWTAMKPAGESTFGSFARLSPLPPTIFDGANRPHLAADGSGHVLAVWFAFDPSERATLTAALYTPDAGGGGSWGAPQAVSTALRTTVMEAAVGVTADGVFDVVYEALTTLDGARDIVARRLTVAGGSATWDGEVVIDGTASAATRPRIAGSGSGHAVAMWSEGGAFASVKAATRSATGGWSSAQDAGGQAAENLNIASVAIDAQGRGVAAMMGDQARVWLRRFEFGGSGFALLGSSQYVHNYTYHHVPPVAVAGLNGRPEVISLHSDGHSISRVRFDGDAWLPQETVHFIDGASVLDVVGSLQAGMDAAGNLMVAWTEQTQPSSHPLLRARRYHAGRAQWRGLADLFTSERVLGESTLAVLPDGSAQLLMARGDLTLGQALFR